MNGKNRVTICGLLTWLVGSLLAPSWLIAGPQDHVDVPLPLSLSQKAAAAALVECEAKGYRVSVAVVDQGGNLKVLIRGDGAGPHTQDSSFKKAYTSASIGRSTNELAALITKIPSLQALRDMNDNILILGGGLPIRLGETVVGGIGVGGAPGADLDENCAKAGLTALQHDMKDISKHK
ncbi:MAG: heme-binding protein [Nitrospirales bacterium]|nr:heme-binding protein [Nitrospira sp.]MDR4501032.1 heme-binding protein [Nitrospirales bacterium]